MIWVSNDFKKLAGKEVRASFMNGGRYQVKKGVLSGYNDRAITMECGGSCCGVEILRSELIDVYAVKRHYEKTRQPRLGFDAAQTRNRG